MKNIDNREETGLEIAVIGMAGRFPGARDVDEFWANLEKGVESINFFKDEELSHHANYSPEILEHPSAIKAKAILDDSEFFDAEYFGYSPREAELLDPQNRVLLETAVHALEDAGVDPYRYKGKIGVFGGASQNSYILYNLMQDPEFLNRESEHAPQKLNDLNLLVTRVAYKLNLKGPAVVVQTACSTSLVAIHMGCQSLLGGESDVVLAGGVSLTFPQKDMYIYQPGGIFSPDGHCRPFDANAGGTVQGEGVGMVVLKRLEDALEDKDNIYGVILGSAINNDGAGKIAYTAPSVEGQAKVIREALSVAEVAPESIEMLETHGTATALGDPIEVAALSRVFQKSDRQYCAIGSVKSNIGHLDVAAGIAGFIKLLQALRNRSIPESLHFTAPNPGIDFTQTPFYVNTKLKPWESNPRRGGLSSFGIGGTNAHLILESAPEESGEKTELKPGLLLVSAGSETALRESISNLIEFLDKNPETNLNDLLYTLQLGRIFHEHRIHFYVKDLKDAHTKLKAVLGKTPLGEVVSRQHKSLVFLFSGQGTQYVDMARKYYNEFKAFRDVMDECFALSERFMEESLKDIVFPGTPGDEAEQKLTRTEFSQPALFALEYATAKFWISLGVIPDSLMGHSIGEYAAACLAGVFSLEDALKLVIIRGRLMQSLPAGAMMAVMGAKEKVEPLLTETVSLGAVNSPELSVLSGPSETLSKLEDGLKAANMEFKYLHTSHAFHSSMMEPILESFRAEFASIDVSSPNIPFISNLTGNWITDEQAQDPNYWVRHLRETVQFSAGIATLNKDSKPVFLEVGPGHMLGRLTESQGGENSGAVLASIPQPKFDGDEIEFFHKTLGGLWSIGIPVDWTSYYNDTSHRKIKLPYYPFQSKSYLYSSGNAQPVRVTDESAPGISSRPGGTQRKQFKKWFYRSVWKRAPLPPWETSKNTPIVAVGAADTGAQDILKALRKENRQIIQVQMGDKFQKLKDGGYILRTSSRSDCRQLFKELKTQTEAPPILLMLGGLTNSKSIKKSSVNIKKFEKIQKRGLYSLLAMAHGFVQNYSSSELNIKIPVNDLHVVTGMEEKYHIENGAIVGYCTVLSEEYREAKIRIIDVSTDAYGAISPGILRGIIGEINVDTGNSPVAFRGPGRWEREFEQLTVPDEIDPSTSVIQSQGAYLITGGLSERGLVIAEYLSRTYQAKIILLDRKPLPEQRKWKSFLNGNSPGEVTYDYIKKLSDIDLSGDRLLYLQADVSNLRSLHIGLTQARAKFGPIKGVFHEAGAGYDMPADMLRTGNRYFFNRQFRIKVVGALYLEKLLKRDRPDFFVFMSSLSSLIGGRGKAGKSAANYMVDVRTQISGLNEKNNFNWKSINWDACYYPDSTTKADGISPLAVQVHEIPAIIERVLASSEAEVIISTNDPAERRLGQDEGLLELSEQQGRERKKYDRPNLKTPYEAPESEAEKILVSLWEELLGINGIGINDNYFELGGHSLLALQFLGRLRSDYQVELVNRTLLESPTIKELAPLLEQQKPKTSALSGASVGAASGSIDSDSLPDPLVELQARGGEPPMFLLHPQDGSAMCYERLAVEMGEDRPLYAVEAPARIDSKTYFDDMKAMASYYLRFMEEKQPEGPLYLAGWSFGGLLAYEISKQLKEKGRKIAFLGMMDTMAPIPSVVTRAPRVSDISMALVYSLMEGAKSLDFSNLVKMSDESLSEFLEEMMFSLGILPPEADQGMRNQFNSVFLSHLHAHMHYLPDKDNQELLLIRAADSIESYYESLMDGIIVLEQARAKSAVGKVGLFLSSTFRRLRHQINSGNSEPNLGWRRYTEEFIHVQESPGHHENMIFGENARVVSNKIRSHLRSQNVIKLSKSEGSKMDNNIIQVKSLVKSYGDFMAVKGINFNIREGEIFGLLGPNGAGKTTTISMLSCLRQPSEGTILFDGLDVRSNLKEIKQMVGVVPQEIALYLSLSPVQNLSYFGKMYGMGGKQLKHRIDEVLDIVSLKDQANNRVKDFSGGMQRRVNLAVGILHMPRILLLDEPTVGVDPQSRNRIFENIRDMNTEKNVTVLYTTHYMEEAQALCKNIAIMDSGTIIAQDTADNLIAQHGQGVIELDVKDFDSSALEQIERINEVQKALILDGKLEVRTFDTQKTFVNLVKILNDLDIHMDSLQIRESNLETVFLNLTGQSLRD